MGAKMLIDAAHPEETRVVVVHGSRVEDFDYESASRKQLRGNIYLAKITRVEPSLQAAFVDYGGNRHGFLAFSEIHPDYYQIPVADRQALLDEEAQEESQAEADEAAVDTAQGRRGRKKRPSKVALEAAGQTGEAVSEELQNDLSPEAPQTAGVEADNGEDAGETGNLADVPRAVGLVEDQGVHEVDDAGQDDNGDDDNVEALGSEDALEEVPERKRRQRRRVYKIQEVIKRRQIILVQVVKEERGNKGAALTTYLSLAGRFTVLMPNTARGGGISRKITNAPDRKRLRKIVGELEIPSGTGLIVRTAGASRTKAEIKRDFEYLLRMWENVRDLTLHSTAPALVYEEGNLIKRSIRDLYDKDIDEVLVAGEDAHKEAKDFMRMLMPSHAKNVKPYHEPAPIFTAFQIERQLSAMFSPEVTLRSGGYIVINQTEALVAIDVNSGKATREHNIEDTALKTNLEAVEELTRQLRLRDLAGLLVIDFIDMEERRNNHAVERRLKDCLRGDRARIQIGRISHFGMLEMSRQRLRPGVLEGSTSPCTQCQGTGIVRSTESVALDVLRTLEDALITEGAHNLSATTAVDVALYILNQKRASLEDIGSRYGVNIAIETDEHLHGANFTISRVASSDGNTPSGVIVQMDWGDQTPGLDKAGKDIGEDAGENRQKRKRRRRRPRNERDDGVGEAAVEASENDAPSQATAEEGDETQAKPSKPRRRGRRGGRRVRAAAAKAQQDASQVSPPEFQGVAEVEGVAEPAVHSETGTKEKAPETGLATEVRPETKPETAPKKRATRGKSPAKTAAAKAEKPKAITKTPRSSKTAKSTPVEPTNDLAPTDAPSSDDKPASTGKKKAGGDDTATPRRGWWRRKET